MRIKLDKAEHILGKKIKKNFYSIGLDWATRTGISFIKTDDKYIEIDFMFIEFKDCSDKKDKYRVMVKTLENLLDDQDLAVVEDVFLGLNRAGSMELAKYHAFAVSECVRKNINYETIPAVSCRAKLNILTTKKAGYGRGMAKKAVADWLENKFNIKLEDEDISDAIILGILGIIEGMNFKKGK